MGVVALGAKYASSDAYEAGGYETATYQYPDESKSIVEPPIVGLLPPLNSIETRYDSSKTEQYDLQAQRWMAWLTGVLAFLTLIGIILIGATLRETGQVLKATRAATSASEELVRVEQSPFCILELVDAETSDYHHNQPHFCKIKNLGRGAGIVVRIYRKWTFAPPNTEPMVIDPDNMELVDNRFERLSILNMPIGGVSSSPPFASFIEQIRVQDIPNFPRIDTWLYFQGFIEFEGLDRETRQRTGFCYLFNPKIRKSGFHVAVLRKAPGKHWYHKVVKKRD